jgi:hypothetical protein
MAKWAEPRTGDLLAALHRIERVAEIIRNDRTGGHQWNAARANEIKELAQMAARMVQGPLDNGK